MSAVTGIEWTKATWNPVVGCEQVSPGCARCYAKTLHDMRHQKHLEGAPMAPQYAVPFETVQLKPERLGYPLSWRAPRPIFVNSVSDLFHDAVPDEYIDKVFAVMTLAQRHTFQVLTKRPSRMRAYLTSAAFTTNVGTSANLIMDALKGRAYADGLSALTDLMLWFENPDALAGERRNTVKLASAALPNGWLGVSVENQRWANERIPILLETPAAVRWLSCEPLLGPVDLTPWLPALDWVVVGGESGKGAREMRGEWAQSIRDQCATASVPFFFKQWGGERDKRGHDDALLDGVRHVAFPNPTVPRPVAG